MANDVFANGREIACKAGAGKTICAFPDTCFTPPENPATPPGVPVPYPNTGFASDTTKGSKKVTISNKEIMLKDQSYFKKSTGDEAGCAAKKGVITSKNTGKVYFQAWSMDVKVEGKNVDRHLDLTTNNHASQTGDTPPWPYSDSVCKALLEECKEEAKELKDACKNQDQDDCSDRCLRAQKCFFPPKSEDDNWCCKHKDTGETTGHHLIEDHWVSGMAGFDMAQGTAGYNAAPTICSNTSRSPGSDHRELHNVQGTYEEAYMPPTATRPAGSCYDPTHPTGGFTYGKGKEACLNAHDAVHGDSNCKRKCLEAQLDAFYGDDNDRPIKVADKRQGLKEDRAPMLEAWGSTLTG